MSIDIKKTGSHYTSKELSKYMAEKLFNYFEKDEKEKYTILDPACGEGELLKAVYQEIIDDNISLIGIDTNKKAIDKAQSYLESGVDKTVHFFVEDYLKLDIFQEDVNLFSGSGDSNEFWRDKKVEEIDMIIANPPYVRTQVLGTKRSQELSKRFGLKGRVDLYHVFLVAMTEHLKENGLICVITSNRYLTTEGGKDIRKFLASNYEILEVIDLGDTKLFDAAVLPAIFIGRKKRMKVCDDRDHDIRFLRIYEVANQEKAHSFVKMDTIYEILKQERNGFFEAEDKKYEVTVGNLKIPEDPKEIWVMATEEDNQWVERVKENSKCTFSDVFHVKVGIKTTADKVFIRDDWDNFPEGFKPENEVLRPLVTSKNVMKWKIETDKIKLKVLYTHENKNGKRQAINLENYPKAKSYLEQHKDTLSAREYLIKARRKWYEIWVPQNPDAWMKPKLVFPDISSSPKFSIDCEGYVVDGNCYWASLKNEDNLDLLYLAVTVANSNFMNKFHEIEFQNQLYAGRKRYVTQYIKNYPLPDPESKYSKKLVEIGKLLASGELEKEEIELYENEIELYVKKAFNF